MDLSPSPLGGGQGGGSPAAVPLIGVDRGQVREATHLGHIAVAGARGELISVLGDPEHATYFRSCAKPLQAVAALRAGIVSRYSLEPEHVAVMSASHSGEPRHVAVVRDLLRRVGVSEEALQCGSHWPLYEPAASEARRQMQEPLAVFNNCSGKHAGMLAAARALGAPIDTYLAPDHPVQRNIRTAVEAFTASAADGITYGVDGCSAPNPAVPLHAMARSFATLVTSADERARSVIDAMVRHPYIVGGTDRLDTRLMEVTGGRIVSKGGAAGAHCAADRRSGRALAVKLESGDGTWMGAVVVAALLQLGWLSEAEVNELSRFARPELRNHRRVVVGSVSPLFTLPLVTAV